MVSAPESKTAEIRQHRRQGVRGIQGSRNRQLVPAGARPRAGNASRNTRRHRRADATRDGGIIWQRPETPQAKRTSAGNSTNTSTPTSPGTCTTPTNPGRCAKPSDCPNKPNWSSTTNQIRAQNETIRDWARQHHCETSEKTKIVSSGLHPTKKPAHRLRDHTRPRHRPPASPPNETRERYLREHDRMSALARRIRPRTGELCHERRQNPQRPRRHRLPPGHPSRPLLRKPRLPAP